MDVSCLCDVLRLRVPSPGIFKQVLRWLRFLSDSYLQYQDGRLDSELDMMSLVMLITDTIQSAITMVRKTQMMAIQYSLLCHRIHAIGSYNRRSTHTVYDSTWNELQIYSGVCHMYVQCMVEYSEGMVQMCRITDALNTDFIARYAKWI